MIFPDGPIMFFDVGGKIVRPVILGNEIKVGNRSGVGSGQKRVSARITDRGRGKSSKEIGIISGGSH